MMANLYCILGLAAAFLWALVGFCWFAWLTATKSDQDATSWRPALWIVFLAGPCVWILAMEESEDVALPLIPHALRRFISAAIRVVVVLILFGGIGLLFGCAYIAQFPR